MITGLGISEMLLVLTLVLLFFGSKEVPSFIRHVAQFIAKVRRYGDEIRREIDGASQSIVASADAQPADTGEKKKELRRHFISKRLSLSPEKRLEKSRTIHDKLFDQEAFREARSVMIYVSTDDEVHTREMMEQMLSAGKRVVVPFCFDGVCRLGIAEIRDQHNELVPGKFGILEPHESLRKNFLKSDIDLVVCPGVAFDQYGARLGRGKGYYDSFLEELKGRITIIGVAYGCQISTDPLPFDYHDIACDQVITENGPILFVQS